MNESDIVEWLRRLMKNRRTAFGEAGLLGCRYEEAANELERLRLENAELLAALKPFARVSIPPELPDDLWTTCRSWPTKLSDDEVMALTKRGVKLDSNESKLLLWIDGITIGVFRRARAAIAKAEAKP